jgi:hypothetical protein
MTQISQAELLQLCAVDADFFARQFFPKAFRDPSPECDLAVWSALDNPNYRLLNLKIARGWAKTTKLRVWSARRIAFGVSRTILWVGASEGHATRSVQWLRAAIEPRIGQDGTATATPFAQTFGLRPGRKWQESEIEIFHGVDQHPIWVLGVGITGNIRGINFDDYRPDLIILDDPITDESAATASQRQKLTDLIMGAVANSLAPRTEEPNAKLVMLQTPLDAEDASGKAEASQEWHTEAFGCWTKATEELRIDDQESSWPSRYPSTDLRQQKRAAIEENRYSIFAREMECKLVAAETLSFRPNWLRKYDEPPKIGTCVISVDPVPPPSEIQLAKGLKGKDYEAISVVGRANGEYYLLDYAVSRGHEPEWTAARMFEYMLRYRPICCVLSLVAAERYLKWYLEKEMTRRRLYLPLKESPIGGKSKFTRILAALNGVGSAGKLWCSKEHTEFILQFEGYGVGSKGHDDLLESVANGVAELTSPYLELTAEGRELLDDSDIEDFDRLAVCP